MQLHRQRFVSLQDEVNARHRVAGRMARPKRDRETKRRRVRAAVKEVSGRAEGRG